MTTEQSDATGGADGPEKTDEAGAATAGAATGKDTPTEGTEPADPWSAFGPAPDPVLTRPRRAVRAVGRFLVHEWTLATVASLVLAVLMTWPTLRYPRYTLPQDYWDPSLQSWQMAWSGHILLTDPAQLWHSNTFFPDQWSFAFSDTLLGYAPAGMLGRRPRGRPAALQHHVRAGARPRHARGVRAGRGSSARAGSVPRWPGSPTRTRPGCWPRPGTCTSSPTAASRWRWRCSPAATAGPSDPATGPERRHAGWAFAGWLVAALAAEPRLRRRAAVRLPGGRRRAGLGGHLVRPALGGAAGRSGRSVAGCSSPTRSVACSSPRSGRCWQCRTSRSRELHPDAARTLAEIDLYSPPASGFFTAPAESRIWGQLHEAARAALPWHPEMTLLPGFVLYALAAAGLFFSVWRVRHRICPAGRGAGDDGPGHGHQVLRWPVHLRAALRLPAGLERAAYAGSDDALDHPAARPARRRCGHRLLRPGTRARRRAGPAVARPMAAAGHPAAAAPGHRRRTEHHPASAGAAAAGGDADGRRPDAGAAQQPGAGPSGDALVDQPVPGNCQRRQRLHPGQPGPDTRRRRPFPRPAQRRLPAPDRREDRGRAARSARRHPMEGLLDRPADGLGITREEVDDAVVFRL